jgi:urea transport system permease protein
VVALLGRYLCLALLAVALDLVWGYCGILSLGHGAFFALGGYAMGMHLMREIGSRGVYAHPVLPDFMVFLGWTELPWFWWGFDMFWFAMLMALAGAGRARLRLRLVRLPLAGDGGLPLDHHAGADLRADARLLPQRDGLRRQQRADRFPRRARLPLSDTTRVGLFVLSGLALAFGLLLGRWITTSKLGKVLVAVRDAESRTRFLGYRVEGYKLFVFTVSAMLAGSRGALRAAGRDHQSGRVRAGELDRDRDLGRRSAGAARWSARRSGR